MNAAAVTLAAVKVPVSTVWSAPDAPRDVDAPAVAAVPDVAGWCDAMDDAVRSGLHGRTVTQVLLGEPVLVRSERDGWSEIVAPWQPSSSDESGYPGWVPSAHLGALPQAATNPVAVNIPVTTLYAEPGSGPVAEVSFGTVLASTERSAGRVRVALPDGADGWLDAGALHGTADPSAAERLRLAGQFLGLRYLWGGTSSYGLDCSGLVHVVNRVLGVRVPRDASDQQAELPGIEPDQARPGDLYFFARPGTTVHHVGFVSGAGMLHASETGRVLEDAPLAEPRRETLVAAARL
jgi:gamma-D-glutamyl-L-lysine dipeptidyl-peptidase